MVGASNEKTSCLAVEVIDKMIEDPKQKMFKSTEECQATIINFNNNQQKLVNNKFISKLLKDILYSSIDEYEENEDIWKADPDTEDDNDNYEMNDNMRTGVVPILSHLLETQMDVDKIHASMDETTPRIAVDNLSTKFSTNSVDTNLIFVYNDLNNDLNSQKH